MSHGKLIETVARSAPIRDDQLGSLDLEGAGSELLQEIMGSAEPDGAAARRRSFWQRLPRRRLVLRAGVAVAALSAAAALILSGNEPRREEAGGVAYAAEWIRIAERNPRLLLGASDWTVTRADEHGRDLGEMTFSDGTAEIELHWYPAESYPGYYEDRAHDATASEIDLLGRDATLFDSGPGAYSAMLRPGGDTFVEIVSDDSRRLDREKFLAVLDTLEAVDAETWLGALPPGVVRPVDRSRVVEGMLEGIPVPPGLDLEELKRGDSVRGRYELGAIVTGAVACAWLERRMTGLESDNTAMVRDAESALATAPQWPILLEMEGDGGWSEGVWDWAEDGRGSTGYGRDTTEHPVGALGCAPAAWRDVPRIDPAVKARLR